jgi:HD-like signal output (HDOD) protein
MFAESPIVPEVVGTSRLDPAEFIAALTDDLDRDSIELLGYPDVAVRIQRALAQDNIGAQQLVKLVGSEPILASRILCMANSVALNPRGEPVTEIRTAVTLMGTDLLRGAVMSYAMAQLRSSPDLKNVAQSMRELWQSSVIMAALCFAVARRRTSIKPDTALLAGLLHGVGKLCILTRASRHPQLLADLPTLATVMSDWHAAVGHALLEKWNMPAEIAEAVGGYEYPDAHEGKDINLTDVLNFSAALYDSLQDPDQLETLVATDPALQRFGASGEECRAMIGDSERQIAEVLESLGM